MIKKLYAAILCAAVTACGGEATSAAQETRSAQTASIDDAARAWKIDYGSSAVAFRGIQEGSEFEGRFNRFDIVVTLDPENLNDASITATIDMSSVDAGNDDRNQSLPTKDWFKINEFPSAVFQSDDITRVNGNNYQAAGTLTMKGITQPLLLPFTLEIDDVVANAAGTVRLNRTDYNIGEGAFADDKWVGYFVDVTVTVAATST